MAKTDIIAIIDRSGSMAWGWEQTRDAFIKFIETQKTVEGTATLTISFFDNTTEILKLCEPLEFTSIESISSLFTDYPPRGATALNDAICETLLKYEENASKADGRVVIIVTDGGENSSINYTKKNVDDFKNTKEKSGNWEFVFMGESTSQAKNYGIKDSNTIVFDKSSISAMNSSFADSFVTLDSVRSCYNAGKSTLDEDWEQVKAENIGK